MSNRVALVTGASRGIGRAIAFSLCRAGFDVVFAARAIEQNQQVSTQIAACPGCGGQAMRINMDVTCGDSVKDAFAAVLKAKTRVDVLVNNAGITRDALSIRMKPADWDAVLDANLNGAFRCIQQVLPGMVRNRWGRIINITSVVGQAGAAGQVNYAASKAGLIGMTKSLARELGSRGITVNAIAPGFIETDMTGVLTEEQKSAILAQVPLGRVGTVDDVAHAAKFLAGDESAYITGQVIAVNGGMYM